MLFLHKLHVVCALSSKRVFQLSKAFLSVKNTNKNLNIYHNFKPKIRINSKETQFETASMSELKKIHLKDISCETFELFNRHVQTEEIQFLNSIFKDHGFEIRMAGGGVRDLLCHIAPHDIDFATPATPTQMIDMLQNIDNVRLITTASGIRHGTVTARINNSSQFEVTTLRIDKETDGRHAEVEFVNDWKIDASRRDLTINSMFIDLNGVLYDYFGGKDDLDNKRIRFVGNIEKRIREDYLRIFRYFRFHSRFGISGQHDNETIQKIKDNLSGLEIISGERIWSELKRIFQNKNCKNSIEVLFQEMDTAHWLGFQHDRINLECFYQTLENILKVSDYPLKYPWLPHALFSSLIKNIDELVSVTDRLKLSNNERNAMAYIITNRDNSQYVNEKIFKSQLALAPKPNQKSLRDFILQYLYSIGSDYSLIETVQEWTIPEFPFKGTMVRNRVKRQQDIALLIDELKKKWAESDFTMNEDDMQSKVDEILEQIESSSK